MSAQQSTSVCRPCPWRWSPFCLRNNCLPPDNGKRGKCARNPEVSASPLISLRTKRWVFFSIESSQVLDLFQSYRWKLMRCQEFQYISCHTYPNSQLLMQLTTLHFTLNMFVISCGKKYHRKSKDHGDLIINNIWNHDISYILWCSVCHEKSSLPTSELSAGGAKWAAR